MHPELDDLVKGEDPAVTLAEWRLFRQPVVDAQTELRRATSTNEEQAKTIRELQVWHGRRRAHVDTVLRVGSDWRSPGSRRHGSFGQSEMKL
jgi:hypothetical protein